MIVLESKERDTASEESKAKESLTGTRTTLCSLSETLQTTALPSSSLYPAPSIYMLHVVSTESTCILLDILLHEAYSAHAYS